MEQHSPTQEELQNVQADIYQAMQDIAYGLGGEELAEQVAVACARDTTGVPYLSGLVFLRKIDETLVSVTMQRADEIEAERNLAALQAHDPSRWDRIRHVGTGLLTATETA